MKYSKISYAFSVLLALLSVASAEGQQPLRDYTCFQVYAPYSPEIDIGSDVAVVYGVGSTFAERAAVWRSKGYNVAMMTGIAWGEYDSYYGSGDAFKKEEVQTVKSGKLLMHGDSTTVGYNVPSDSYIEYIKSYVEPAVDDGVSAVYLEEPEFWADAGWSESFKREWQLFYGEPWQEPDSSPDAQYRASKLKYELYFKALKEVFAHIKNRAEAKGRTIECHVPTHSLISYAHWRIVSPESHLIDIPQLDGYIAQVWTGTARTPNVYRGVAKERTFETAFLEYGQMQAMDRPTGKKVWFLADPVEDNPNRSWNDYKLNYECTIIASLMWPETARYEVMPWPDRIFKGSYPKVDLDSKTSEREGIPSDYATQLSVVINALNDMNQTDVVYDMGTRGIGVIVSDTMMFQRAAPNASDSGLGAFYGLAIPLLKVGVPADVVQLENTIYPACLEPYRVLLLTYEHQKPLKAEYHAALEKWVRNGGSLILVDDGSDPYHGVREWWNEQGATSARAYDDLLKRLGATAEARTAPQSVDKGFVRVVEKRASDLTRTPEGADLVRALVSEMLAKKGETLKTQPYLALRRGPYLIASVLDETIVEAPSKTFTGRYVNLFDAALPIVSDPVLKTNERALLYDLRWPAKTGVKAKVVAAGGRVRNEKLGDDSFSFDIRGPLGTTANARILLPKKPSSVAAGSNLEAVQEWDSDSSTLRISLPNTAEDVHVVFSWEH